MYAKSAVFVLPHQDLDEPLPDHKSLVTSAITHIQSENKFMNEISQPIPKDQPALYRIQIDGKIDDRISNWFEDMTISTESRKDGKTFSTLSGVVPDQAALHGLLSRIYTLGLLVVSVVRVE